MAELVFHIRICSVATRRAERHSKRGTSSRGARRVRDCGRALQYDARARLLEQTDKRPWFSEPGAELARRAGGRVGHSVWDREPLRDREPWREARQVHEAFQDLESRPGPRPES